MFENLNRDAQRLAPAGEEVSARRVIESLLFDNGFQAVVFYRLARWFKVRRIPMLGPLFSRAGLLFTGVEISASAEIGPGLKISHGTGLVIGGYAKLGRDVHLLHGVTLGSPSGRRLQEMPVIEDGVFIGAGAAVIGAVTVGAGAKIAPGCLVLEDIPPGARVRPAAGISVELPGSQPTE